MAKFLHVGNRWINVGQIQDVFIQPGESGLCDVTFLGGGTLSLGSEEWAALRAVLEANQVERPTRGPASVP
jgi:hypothetical protein